MDAFFDFQHNKFCGKCERYYNPDLPHLCDKPPDLERERQKLMKWLGKGAKVVK